MKYNLKINGAKMAIIFLFAGVFLSFNLKHPFYLSVTELKYDPKTKSLQTAIKLFTNDLEDGVKKIYKQPVDLINGKNKDINNKLLSDYLQKHLIIKVNGKLQAFNFIGFEKEEEAIWTYVEFKNCPIPKKIDIENTLLFDFLPAQSNIVNCEVNATKKNYKVTNPEKSIRFQF